MGRIKEIKIYDSDSDEYVNLINFGVADTHKYVDGLVEVTKMLKSLYRYLQRDENILKGLLEKKRKTVPIKRVLISTKALRKDIKKMFNLM